MAEMTIKNEETPLKKCKKGDDAGKNRAEKNAKEDFDEDIGAK